MHRVRKRTLIASFTILALGCGGGSAAAGTARAARGADLYPLVLGYAWSFDIDTGTGVNTLGVMRVRELSATRAVVETTERAQTYELASGGIRRADTQTWLLPPTLEEGSSWPCASSRTCTLRWHDQSITVPAGTFSFCADVRETSADADLTIVTTYCSGVGPVRIATHQTLSLNPAGAGIDAVLRAHGPTEEP